MYNDAWFKYLDDKTPNNLRDAMWETWKIFVLGVPYSVGLGELGKLTKGIGVVGIFTWSERLIQITEDFLDSGYRKFSTWIDDVTDKITLVDNSWVSKGRYGWMIPTKVSTSFTAALRQQAQ